MISYVYFVPGLKNNLLSVGQLQQKGLRIIIEDDMCDVWHKQQRRLIMQSTMSTNRMFVILAKVRAPRGEMEANHLHSSIEVAEEIWQKRFGHLNHNSLATLAEKEMVTGLPKISIDGVVCEICMKGKQSRENIPKQSVWRSSRGLNLVHSEFAVRYHLSQKAERGI